MTVTEVAPVETAAAAGPAAALPTRGRTSISTRALNRVATAIGANSLGVDIRDISVDFSDDHGGLALAISAPIRLVSLNRIRQDEAVITRTGGTIMQRAADARSEIRSQVAAVTGCQITRVVVHLTGASIQQERRVK